MSLVYGSVKTLVDTSEARKSKALIGPVADTGWVDHSTLRHQSVWSLFQLCLDVRDMTKKL